MSDVLPAWQQGPFEALVAVHARGRLPHALLLDGPDGWGARIFARALARYLLELPQNPTVAPATGARDGEQAVDQDLLAHRDARIVRRSPSPTSGKLRAQITVDEVRALGEFLVRTAGAGGARVAIVELAEDLNMNAANALLKRLEEPGEGTHLLLVTAQSSRVLATVRSRCQRVVLPPGTPGQARAWLEARLPESSASVAGTERDACDMLLALAGGAPLRALDFAARDALPLAQAVDAALDGGPIEPLTGEKLRLETDAARARAALVLELLYRALAARVRSVVAEGEQPPHGPTLQRWQRLLDGVLRAQRRLQSAANPNVTLLLEELLIGIAARGAAATGPTR